MLLNLFKHNRMFKRGRRRSRKVYQRPFVHRNFQQQLQWNAKKKGTDFFLYSKWKKKFIQFFPPFKFKYLWDICHRTVFWIKRIFWCINNFPLFSSSVFFFFQTKNLRDKLIYLTLNTIGNSFQIKRCWRMKIMKIMSP